MTPPHRWADDQLQRDLNTGAEDFRIFRLQEEPGAYTAAFDHYQTNVEHLLEMTVDLTDWEDTALQILSDKKLFLAFRYLMGVSPWGTLDGDLMVLTPPPDRQRRGLA